MVDGSVDIKGTQGVEDRLDGMRSRIEGWTDASPRIRGWLLQRQKELWATQGSSEGVRWPALPEKWAAFKARIGVDTRPLRWLPGTQERLFPSLTKKGHPDQRWRVVAGRKVEFGTEVPYASRHDQGKGVNPFGEKIRQRRLAVLSQRNQERLAQLLAIYVARGTTRDNRWDK